MEITITLALVIITCIISFTALINEKIINDLIFWSPMVKNRNQYYRFITSGFIHGNIWHLVFNMTSLYFMGSAMEFFFIAKIGKIGYLLFYVGGIIVSEIPSYIKHQNDQHYRSLGASGAITGIVFAYVLLAPWSMLGIFFIPMPAIVFAVLYLAFTIYMDKRGDNFLNHNHSAHLWGAIWGLAFTIIMEPRVIPYFIEKLMNPSF
jgi:membrane associated rhomboid family serine protease